MGKQKSTGTGGKASAPEPKFGDLAADCEGGQDTLSTTDQGLMINRQPEPAESGRARGRGARLLPV